MSEPTILILGAGTFGTSTAYHLSQTYTDPSRITIIDRAPLPNPSEPAAAIDLNRVIRTDYMKSLYCNLANQALHDWFWKLELARYFHGVGWLYFNEEGSGVSEGVRRVFEERGAQRAEGVKGTRVEGFDGAYFNEQAGWCDAAEATGSLLRAAVEKGVKRVSGEAVGLVLDREEGVVKGVRLESGEEIRADKVVLTLGAWTSALLAPVERDLGIGESDSIERQIRATGAVAAYYPVSDEEVTRLEASKMPIVVYGQRGEVIPPSREKKLLKYSNTRGTFTNSVTTESGRRISMPRANTAENQRDIPNSLKRETEDLMTSKVMPEFAKGKQVKYWRICWDALTPTEDWLMCRHPHSKLQNLYLAVGGSFHSYKFLPIAGKFMLNVLNNESNGEEKDEAWAWKKDVVWNWDSTSKVEAENDRVPTRELRDLYREGGGSRGKANAQAKL